MYKLLTKSLLIAILIITSSLGTYCQQDDPKVSWKINKFQVGKIEPFTQKRFSAYLKELEIQHTDIVYAQAVLETGHFNSLMFRKRNNLFGFRTMLGYLKFDSWKDCCHYYAKWQKKHYNGEDYYVFLEKIGYAEDSTYVSKLKQIVNVQNKQ